MENLFLNMNTETASADIKGVSAPGIYTPGIHEIVNTEIYLYESEYNGTTYNNAEIIMYNAEDATIKDELRTIPKSNQTQSDLLNYLYNLALITGKVDALESLKVGFNALPTVDHKTKYNKDVKAKVIKIFANTKLKVMTYSELSGSAEGIFTSQRLVLNQAFRFSDNASLAEVKEDSTDCGSSFDYWGQNEDSIHKKAQIRYNKNRDQVETDVLEVVLDHIKAGKKLEKADREKIQGHWDVSYAKQVLSGETATKAKEAPVAEEEEPDRPFA